MSIEIREQDEACIDQLAGVASIGPDQHHGRDLPEQRREQRQGTGVILDVGGVQLHDRYQAKHVHDEEALAPCTSVARS